VLTDASNGQTGLTQLEVDGFFGNNRVKIALFGTKVTNSGNADTLGTKTLATIKQEIKDEGQVLTSKYLYSDPSMGGQKSYIDITSDILRAKNDVMDGATTEYNTLKKIENIVKSNKSTIETSLNSETSNRNIAVNLLQTNINTEKSRVDAILLGADTDKNSFAEIKTYIDGLTGSLSLSTTALGNGVVRNVINITNALETRLVSYESSSTSTTSGLSNTVDKIEAAVGLASNGNLSPISGKNYVTGASSVLNAVYALDTALKLEETTRNNKDVEAKTYADNIKIAVDGEITRAKTVEGTLNLLTSNSKMNLVSAINSVVADLTTEISERSTNNTTLSDKINTTNTDLASEVSRAKSIEGTLISLTTTNKTNLVEAINESITKIKSEETRALGVEGVLSSLTTTNKATLVGAINELRTSITTETNSRVTAISNFENSLSTQINTEKTRINKVVEGLGFSNIDTLGTISFNETTYLNSKTKIKDALITLDESLRSVNSIQTSRTDVLVSQINSVIGLNSGVVNYSNVINSGSNYIKNAKSMLDADNILDYQLKINTDIISKITSDSSVDGSFAKGDLYTLNTAKDYTNSKEITITTGYKNYTDTTELRLKSIQGDLVSLTTTNKTTLVDAINESITKIKSEETRALGIESGITTNLNNEINRAKDAESTLDSNIKDEINRAKSVEGVLSSLTTTNKATLVGAINELKDGIFETNDVYGLDGIINYTNGTKVEIKQDLVVPRLKTSKIELKTQDENYLTINVETSIIDNKTINDLKYDGSRIVTDKNIENAIFLSGGVMMSDINTIHTILGTNKSDLNYIGDLTAHYISAAINFKDADKKLDTEIKIIDEKVIKKISKENNLSDLTDFIQARKNLNVYSIDEVDDAINVAKLSLGTNYSIETMDKLNTLDGLTIGDNVFVVDDGDNKWAIYRITGINPSVITQKIMDQDIFLENFTSGEKTKLSSIESGAQVNTVFSVANKIGDIELEKKDIKDFNENDYVKSVNYKQIIVTENSVTDGIKTFEKYTHPSKHTISEITDLQIELDKKLDATKVLTDVPENAIFTDTKYKLETTYFDVVILDVNNFNSNGGVVLEYEITKGGISVVDNITKNIRVYIGGRKLRNTKFNIINTPNTKNMFVIESVMEVTGFSVGDEVEIEIMSISTI